MLKPLAWWWHIQDDMRKIVMYVNKCRARKSLSLRPFFAWSKLSLIEIKLRFVPSTLINPSCLFLSDSWCDGNLRRFFFALKIKAEKLNLLPFTRTIKYSQEICARKFLHHDYMTSSYTKRRHLQYAIPEETQKITVTSQRKEEDKNFNNFITQTSQK